MMAESEVAAEGGERSFVMCWMAASADTPVPFCSANIVLSDSLGLPAGTIWLVSCIGCTGDLTDSTKEQGAQREVIEPV